MRYKVKIVESLEFVIEGNNEEDVIEWMKCNTIQEVRSINPQLKLYFENKILSKTVMPADVTTETYIEDIPDDNWNKRDTSYLHEDEEND